MIQLVSDLEYIFLVSPHRIMSPIVQYFHGHEQHQPDTNHWETVHMILAMFTRNTWLRPNMWDMPQDANFSGENDWEWPIF